MGLYATKRAEERSKEGVADCKCTALFDAATSKFDTGLGMPLQADPQAWLVTGNNGKPQTVESYTEVVAACNVMVSCK